MSDELVNSITNLATTVAANIIPAESEPIPLAGEIAATATTIINEMTENLGAVLESTSNALAPSTEGAPIIPIYNLEEMRASLELSGWEDGVKAEIGATYDIIEQLQKFIVWQHVKIYETPVFTPQDFMSAFMANIIPNITNPAIQAIASSIIPGPVPTDLPIIIEEDASDAG